MEKDYNYYYYLNLMKQLPIVCNGESDDNFCSYVLKQIPNEYWKDRDFCLEACDKEILVPLFSEDFWYDSDFCKEVLKKQGGWILEDFVPEEFKTKEFYLEIAKDNCYIFEEILEEYWKNEKFCEEAVEINGFALGYVPEKFKTKELCLKALETNGEALKDIPENLKNYDMCHKAVSKYGFALSYVPEELIDEKMCLEAIRQNIHNLHYVPKEYKTYDLCLEAVKNGYDLKNVPKEFVDTNMCYESTYLLRDKPFRLKQIIDSFPEGIRESEFTTDLMEAVYRNGLTEDFKLSHAKYFMSKLELLQDNSIDFNKGIEKLTIDDLKDETIKSALINRFKKYEISECYNLDKLQKYPEVLLETIKGINFKEAGLLENENVYNYHKNLNYSNILDDIEINEVDLDLYNMANYEERIYPIKLSKKDASIIESIVKDPEISLDNLVKCARIVRDVDIVGDKDNYSYCVDPKLKDTRENIPYNEAKNDYCRLLKGVSNILIETIKKDHVLSQEDLAEINYSLNDEPGDIKAKMYSVIETLDSIEKANEKKQFGED